MRAFLTTDMKIINFASYPMGGKKASFASSCKLISAFLIDSCKCDILNSPLK